MKLSKKLSIVLLCNIFFIVETIYAQAPIIDSISATTTKNIIPASTGLLDSDSLKIQNTGTIGLYFSMKNSPSSTCVAGGMLINGGTTISLTVADLGGVASGLDLNSTNNTSTTGSYKIDVKPRGPGGGALCLPASWVSNCAAATGPPIVYLDPSNIFVNPVIYVGIGTNNPQYPLHVVGESFLDGDATISDLFVTNGSSVGGSHFVTGGQSIMGNVGIGQSIPASTKFAIKGNGSTSATSAFNATNSGSQSLLFLRDDGNIGIGTTTPAQKLHVNGGNIILKGVNNFITSGNEAILYLGDNNYFIKGVNGSGVRIGVPTNPNALTILNNGNVGIGTTCPNYKLNVNGIIKSREILVEVSGPWCDYVFKKEYKKMTLEEIEQFILKNGHLPGIPAAKEIEDNGIKVSEMTTKMMEKIEELTLFTIEQNKKIQELQKQLEAIK